MAIDILLMQKADEYLEKDFTLYFPPKFSDNDASKCMTVFAETFGNKTCKEPVSIELEKGIKISDATLIKMLKLFGNLQTLKIPYGYLTDGLVDLLGTYKGLQSIWLTGVGGGGLPSDVGQRLNKLHGMNDQIKIYFE